MSDPQHPAPHEHPHEHPNPGRRSPRRADPSPDFEDTGSRALSEALRSSFFFVKIVMVLLALAFVFSGARMVQPGERALRLHFGKPVGQGQAMLLGPGLHLAYPPPIDEIVRIPIGEVQSVHSTVGWYRSATPGVVSPNDAQYGPSLNPEVDGYALTGDTNIIHVFATLRYRVKDPIAYVFNFADASNVVQQVLDNALVFAAAQMSADLAIKAQATFREIMFSRIDEEISKLKLGISPELVDLEIIAPRQVKAAFDAVTEAELTSAQKVKTAQGQAESRLARAQSQAAAIVYEAQADRDAYLKELEKFAQSYRDQLPKFKKNPELFRQILLTETWQKVLASAADKFFLPDRVDGKPRQLWLQINREPETPKTAAQAAAQSSVNP